jgi:hypothetical protein
MAQTAFSGSSLGREFFGAIAGQQMTNERGREPFDQLSFFMAAKGSRTVDFAL